MLASVNVQMVHPRKLAEVGREVSPDAVDGLPSRVHRGPYNRTRNTTRSENGWRRTAGSPLANRGR
jgi:hypothetical protein